jgi:hypothetical protein
MRSLRAAGSLADVLAFIGALGAYMWIIAPLAAGRSSSWEELLLVAILAVPVGSLWRRGAGLADLGLRLDNLPLAVPLYLGGALAYTGAVLSALEERAPLASLAPLEFRGALGLVGWGFMQEFCLLAFILRRLREVLHAEGLAVIAAAAVFALFHLPNPFLTMFSFGGALVGGVLFLRWPNLLAASVAHAAASLLAGRLLPPSVTGGMRVGPFYGL